MDTKSGLRLKFTLLDVSAYIALGAVSVPALISLFSDQHAYRWVAVGLIFIFGFLMFVHHQLPEQFLGMSPTAYMVMQTIVVAALLLFTPHNLIFIILFFILSVESVRFQPSFKGYFWTVAFSLITAIALIATAGLREALYIIPIYIGAYVFFAIFAATTIRAESAREESQALLEELKIAHQKLQTYAARVEDLTVVEERNRLAREMHDTLGHWLTVAAVQLEGVQRLITTDPERALQMTGIARSQVRQALGELRRTVATLREPLEVDLSLPNAIKRLAKVFEQATDIRVEMAFDHNLPDLPDEYRIAFYRAAQEALTNVQRHAQAKLVSVRLRLDEEQVKLIVNDDGIGLQPDTLQEGFGLRGLQERADHLGGEVRLEAKADGGAQLCFCLPWQIEGTNG
ncbi:MAG: sensor histidine kinase [Chloroflexota bacterium]